MHVPYSYGFAIILLTVLVKAATFPLTKKQVNIIIFFHLSTYEFLDYLFNDNDMFVIYITYTIRSY